MDMYIGVIIGYSRVALMAPPVAKQKTFQLVPVFLGYTFFFFFFFLMWTIFKVFNEFVTTLFLFYVLFSGPKACRVLAP